MQEATFTFLVKDGNATIGAVGGADGTAGEHKDYVEAGYWWYKVDNFRLVKNRDLTPEEEFVAATPEDYAALNEAIETAEGYVLGFDQDDYAPYNNVEALEALAAAKAIDQEANNAQEDVQAATAAITGATWTANSNEVNAVYDGTFANAENNGAPAGWTMTNNDLGGSYHARAFVGDDRLAEFNNTKSAFYIRFDGTNSTKGSLYKYGETSGYTMPLKASTVYYVSADLAGWGQKDKTIRINVGGPSGFEGTYEDATMSIRADQTDDAPIHVKFFFTTGEAGDYRISLQNPGANVDNAAVISNIEIKRAPEVTVTGTLAAGKYATRIFPFVPEKTENISFYSCEAVDANGKTLTLAIVDENELKANTRNCNTFSNWIEANNVLLCQSIDSSAITSKRTSLQQITRNIFSISRVDKLKCICAFTLQDDWCASRNFLNYTQSNTLACNSIYCECLNARRNLNGTLCHVCGITSRTNSYSFFWRVNLNGTKHCIIAIESKCSCSI